MSADARTHTVTLADGSTVTGDILVLAAGAQPNFFHTPGAAEFAFPLYSLDDAERCAPGCCSSSRTSPHRPELIDEGALNFVVVGAGADRRRDRRRARRTGARRDAAALRRPRPRPPRGSSSSTSAHAPLGAFSDAAHAYATKQLDHRGVELMLGAGVTEVARDHVTLSGDTTIKTHLTVWGGGEMAAPVIAASGLPVGRGGRVDVDADLTVDGFPGVYAVGDAANIPDGDGGIAAAARQRRAAGRRLGRLQHPGRHRRRRTGPRSTTTTRASWR